MATIYPNKKDGKIISVKLKAYLGRDEHGKQIFRCKNWIPEKDMTANKSISSLFNRNNFPVFNGINVIKLFTYKVT